MGSGPNEHETTTKKNKKEVRQQGARKHTITHTHTDTDTHKKKKYEKSDRCYEHGGLERDCAVQMRRDAKICLRLLLTKAKGKRGAKIVAVVVERRNKFKKRENNNEYNDVSFSIGCRKPKRDADFSPS